MTRAGVWDQCIGFRLYAFGDIRSNVLFCETSGETTYCPILPGQGQVSKRLQTQRTQTPSLSHTFRFRRLHVFRNCVDESDAGVVLRFVPCPRRADQDLYGAMSGREGTIARKCSAPMTFRALAIDQKLWSFPEMP
jgi:hypothetical protein